MTSGKHRSTRSHLIMLATDWNRLESDRLFCIKNGGENFSPTMKSNFLIPSRHLVLTLGSFLVLDWRDYERLAPVCGVPWCEQIESFQDIHRSLGSSSWVDEIKPKQSFSSSEVAIHTEFNIIHSDDPQGEEEPLPVGHGVPCVNYIHQSSLARAAK